ncbi:hypothetical protein BX666DRAFT_2103797 [Dichotomocladium elegans]|nr:hypothetical protein BX666DRAFT_2103797 [Dichotomocladium elegans]
MPCTPQSLAILVPQPLSFPPQDHDDHLIAHQFDVTNALYELRCSIVQHKWTVSLEDHVHHALALNSILLLSPGQYLGKTRMQTADSLQYNHRYSRYQHEAINRDKAIVNFWSSISYQTNANSSNRRSIDQKPTTHAYCRGCERIGTQHPIIDPFLNGLFDDPDGGVFLCWTSAMTLESRKNDGFWTRHPDLHITSLKGVKWSTSHGYGEAKKLKISRDVIQVGTFCKNALDSQNLDDHALYLDLPSTGLHIMYELGSIKLHNTLHDLPKLVMDMPCILRILGAFDRLCIRSANLPQPMRHRPTISVSNLNSIFSSSQDCKRPCHLKQYHN